MAFWGGIAIAAGSVIGGLLSSDSASDTAGAAQQAAQLQWDIADRIQKRAEELFELWRNEYKPGELALKNEVYGLTPYVTQYATAAQRARVEVRKSFAMARRKALEGLDVHCLGAQAGMIKDLSIAEASAAGWASIAMIRAEDTLKRTLDHQYRQEKYQLAAFGHNAYFKSDASAVASQIAANLQRAASAASASQSQAAGYFLKEAFNGGGKALASYLGSRNNNADRTPSNDTSSPNFQQMSDAGAPTQGSSAGNSYDNNNAANTYYPSSTSQTVNASDFQNIGQMQEGDI